MIDILKSILGGHNQFASGGLLLMIVGGIGVYLRAVPLTVWRWIVRQTTMMITVNDEDAAFTWVKEWFLEQEFLKKIRHLDLDTKIRGERISMIPAPGPTLVLACPPAVHHLLLPERRQEERFVQAQ